MSDHKNVFVDLFVLSGSLETSQGELMFRHTIEYDDREEVFSFPCSHNNTPLSSFIILRLSDCFLSRACIIKVGYEVL